MVNRYRYVVLGLVVDIERWRHERGLARHEVLAVPTHNAHVLRGRTFGPEVEVVTLPSWSHASGHTRAEVEYSLNLSRAAASMH